MSVLRQFSASTSFLPSADNALSITLQPRRDRCTRLFAAAGRNHEMRKSLAGDISRFIARQSDRRKQATNKSSACERPPPLLVHAVTNLFSRQHSVARSFVPLYCSLVETIRSAGWACREELMYTVSQKTTLMLANR